jgi:hypothetical protein
MITSGASQPFPAAGVVPSAACGGLPSSRPLAEPWDTFTKLVRVNSRCSRSSVFPAPGVSGIPVTHWDVRIAL